MLLAPGDDCVSARTDDDDDDDNDGLRSLMGDQAAPSVFSLAYSQSVAPPDLEQHFFPRFFGELLVK